MSSKVVNGQEPGHCVALEHDVFESRKIKRSKVANQDVMDDVVTLFRDEIKVVSGEASIRFTRSALREKVEQGNEFSCVEETPNSKMPKMQGKHWKLKQLLATSLLDGYNVFYTSSIHIPVLHGVIKNGGISCFCGMCKGSTIITPCQFEIHA